MTPRMSETLRRLDLESEAGRDFLGDFRRLVRLSADARDRSVRALVPLLRARTGRARKAVENEVLDGLPDDPADVLAGLALLEFFAAGLAGQDQEDDPDVLATELADAAELGDAERNEAHRLLNRLRDEVVPERRRQRYARGILPSLVGVGTTVELRAVQGTQFRAGQGLASYTPNIEGVVGIVSIAISTDDPIAGRFFFQTDEAGLTSFLDALQSAQADLSALTSLATRGMLAVQTGVGAPASPTGVDVTPAIPASTADTSHTAEG